MSTTVKVGKYTYVVTDDGRIEILRHGETWRTETGDNALLALIMEVEALNKVAECAPELMRKGRCMSNVAYNLGQSHEQWSSSIYPGTREYDEAEHAMRAALREAQR